MSPKALSKMHQQPPSLAPDLPPPPESCPQWSPSWIMTLGGIICICIFFSCYGNLRRHCSNVGGIPLIRNQNRRQLPNDVNPDSPSLQFNSHGLDSFILHSIPTLQFQTKEGETGQGNIDCAVCLGEFKDGERLRSLPNCSHCFHVPCIDTWFQNHSNCPLCRSPVITSISFEPLRRESSIPEPIRGYPVLLEAPVNSTVT